MDRAAHRDRGLWTIPNLVSIARLLCVPVFVWLLVDDHRLAAGVLLGVLGASDWVDGWIARRYDQVSEIGKVLDPAADRILLMTTGFALVLDGAVPLVVGVAVLAREVVVTTAVLILAAAGANRIDVQWAGKAGTLALMFAFPAFLLADAIDGAHDALLVVAWGFAVAGLALSYYAAATYIPLARRALREGRGQRGAPSNLGSATR